MEKKGNSKLVWYILFAVVTVILCYLFTVVYFYFISPYNISLKLGFWPFLSDAKIGDMYADATVEINFVVKNEEFQQEEKNVLGVNVRKDGYVIAPYSDFVDVDEETVIKIYSNSGRVFYGKLLFADKDYNLAIIKLQNTAEGQGEIALPFVSIASLSHVVEDDEIICVSSPVSDKNILTGVVYETGYDVPKISQKDGSYVIDSLQEYCFVVDLNSKPLDFVGGAIFDKNASFLGFSYDHLISLASESYAYVMPAESIKFVLDKVVENYQNNSNFTCELRQQFVGFDQFELAWFIDCSSENIGDENNFYFNSAWYSYSDEITYYANSDYQGYYLMTDFVYNDATINANSVITALKVGETMYDVLDKYNLFETVYKLNKGDKVTIFYEQFQNSTAQAKNVTITV